MSWDQETIGKRIRRLREERGLTQGQLGETTDLSEASIDRIEKEAARLLGEYIERLANRLGVSEHYLRHGDSHAERETGQLIGSMVRAGGITEIEGSRLMEIAGTAIKLRNNARVPLSRVEIEELLAVIKG